MQLSPTADQHVTRRPRHEQLLRSPSNMSTRRQQACVLHSVGNKDLPQLPQAHQQRERIVREDRSHGCDVIRWLASNLLGTCSELVWIQSHETQTRWWKSCATYPRSAPSLSDTCFQDRWPSKTKPSTTCATWACLGTGMWRFMCHDYSCNRSASGWSVKQDERSSEHSNSLVKIISYNLGR